MYCTNSTTRNVIPVDTKKVISNPITEQSLYNDFTKTYSNRGYFIYSPKTLETDQIMELVAKNFNISFANIATALNENEMIKKFKTKFNNIDGRLYGDRGFGIVFEEILKHNALKYKIRSTNNVWKTNLLFPGLETPRFVDSSKVYIEKGFLALQFMIDKAFIIKNMNSTYNRTNINDYNFKIQSFPRPELTGNSGNVLFEQSLRGLFPLFTILGFLLTCSNTIKRVTVEKFSGVKELMKMMGLKSWMIWTGWMLHNLSIHTISITIITYISCYEVHYDSGKLLNYTSPLLFWIFLVVYSITGVMYCFAICSLINSPVISLAVGSSSWLFSYSIAQHIMKSSANSLIRIFSMLLPNIALTNAFMAISSLETLGIGLHLSTLFTTGVNKDEFSVGFVLIMLVFDCFLYGFITWYFDSIMPGKYGIAKPWNFFCDWSKTKYENNVMMYISKHNNKYFEHFSNDFETGISMKNVHKKFGDFKAVNGVDLDLYKGQITVLLGHNGAGKTTVMSIISGV